MNKLEPQRQSPTLCTLPAEIIEEIFRWVHKPYSLIATNSDSEDHNGILRPSITLHNPSLTKSTLLICKELYPHASRARRMRYSGRLVDGTICTSSAETPHNNVDLSKFSHLRRQTKTIVHIPRDLVFFGRIDGNNTVFPNLQVATISITPVDMFKLKCCMVPIKVCTDPRITLAKQVETMLNVRRYEAKYRDRRIEPDSDYWKPGYCGWEQAKVSLFGSPGARYTRREISFSCGCVSFPRPERGIGYRFYDLHVTFRLNKHDMYQVVRVELTAEGAPIVEADHVGILLQPGNRRSIKSFGPRRWMKRLDHSIPTGSL